jgi:hypothetical protein
MTMMITYAWMLYMHYNMPAINKINDGLELIIGGDGSDISNFRDVGSIDDMWDYTHDFLVPLIWVGDCITGCPVEDATNYDPSGKRPNSLGVAPGEDGACTSTPGQCKDDASCEYCSPGGTWQVKCVHHLGLAILTAPGFAEPIDGQKGMIIDPYDTAKRAGLRACVAAAKFFELSSTIILGTLGTSAMDQLSFVNAVR